MLAPAHDTPHHAPWRWYVLAMTRRYAKFSGRARRAEYWWFVLFNMLVGMALWGVAMAASGAVDTPSHLLRGGHGAGAMAAIVLYDLYGLAALVPGLAVAVRRLHDRDHSGWWLLLYLVPLVGPIVILVWLCLAGDVGDNRFGADPCTADTD